ncbi:MAG: hypothetical protein H7122_16025 [Chitinophagaceae bacterium]|nr:hypothetical protein [Chitinophagaceae bacterium]
MKNKPSQKTILPEIPAATASQPADTEKYNVLAVFITKKKLLYSHFEIYHRSK